MKYRILYNLSLKDPEFVEADLLEIKSSGHAVFMRILNEAECFGLGQVYSTKLVIEPKEYCRIDEVE